MVNLIYKTEMQKFFKHPQGWVKKTTQKKKNVVNFTGQFFFGGGEGLLHQPPSSDLLYLLSKFIESIKSNGWRKSRQVQIQGQVKTCKNWLKPSFLVHLAAWLCCSVKTIPLGGRQTPIHLEVIWNRPDKTTQSSSSSCNFFWYNGTFLTQIYNFH